MSQSNLATPELAAVEIHGQTRQSFILKGALTAGAVFGAGAVSPFVRQAIAADGAGDVAILNFALTLEYLEAAFYTQALMETKGLSAETKTLAKTIKGDEDAHVAALMTAIKGAGGKPVKAPMVDFGTAFKNQKSFLKLAQTFEDTGVSAYNGAAPGIQSKAILAAAGSIVQVEARHAAAIRLMNGQPPTDGGFDKSLDVDAVLAAVKPFVKT
jgi:hypothetical protein